MAFELHIWGPGFGLPSIHPECIAAVAYLTYVLSPTDWAAIPDHDPSCSASNDFPILHHGPKRISGFRAIVAYISAHRPSRCPDPDSSLSPQQRADSTALSTHIPLTAQPLLDLSLYTSTTNYRAATLPAYAALLPTLLTYTVPAARRDAAKARVRHLGLRALDLDGEVDADDKPAASHRDIPPQRRNKGTIAALLRRPAHASGFQLEALVDACVAPLQAWLEFAGEQRYLLGGTAPTSVDFLAYGYLSLMLVPGVPRDWLGRMIRGRFGGVVAYVRRVGGEVFGEGEMRRVPWGAPAPFAVGDGAVALARQIAGAVPWTQRVVVREREDERGPNQQPDGYLSVMGVAGGALALLGYLISTHLHRNAGNVQTFYAPSVSRLSKMGEAGAALAAGMASWVVPD